MGFASSCATCIFEKKSSELEWIGRVKCHIPHIVNILITLYLFLHLN